MIQVEIWKKEREICNFLLNKWGHLGYHIQFWGNGFQESELGKLEVSTLYHEERKQCSGQKPDSGEPKRKPGRYSEALQKQGKEAEPLLWGKGQM